MNKKGMRVILLTSDKCPPCEGAKTALKQYIERGEIEVLSIQESDEAADLALKGKFTSTPQLLVVSKTGEIFGQLAIEE